MPREDLVRKALIAKTFREETVNDFLQETKAMLYQEWLTTVDKEQRDFVWLKAMGIEAFEKWVEMIIIDGNHAAAELEKKVEREKKGKK